tara:strand:- start:21 stop:755 length:735 start_codon:yes stop_codon:yes gene_type:complete
LAVDVFPALKNKNVLLTGSTGGIGTAIALELSRLGANLFLTGTDNKKLLQLHTGITEENKAIKIGTFAADLADPRDLTALVREVREMFSEIDVLINCAGVFKIESISSATIESYDESFAVNVRAPYLLIKEFCKDMIANEWGKIVNIGSSSSYNGFPNTSSYCASKHALLGLSRSLYQELKPYGVKVYCFSPGSVQTKMGKLVEGQDYSTFIDSKELANYICYTISFDSNMIAEEIRLNRFILQ